jgi:hypothetical protein
LKIATTPAILVRTLKQIRFLNYCLKKTYFSKFSWVRIVIIFCFQNSDRRAKNKKKKNKGQDDSSFIGECVLSRMLMEKIQKWGFQLPDVVIWASNNT